MTSRMPSPPAYRLYQGPDGRLLINDGASERTSSPRPASYLVGECVIHDTFGVGMPDELSDLIAVAMAVYAADRLCPRDPRAVNRYDRLPPRSIDLCLGVHQPDYWNSQEVGSALRDYLWFLTEDLWTFRFFPVQQAPLRTLHQQYLFPTPPTPPVHVILFSGGLDSLAGLCHYAIRHPTASFVAVAGQTNSRLEALQRSLLRGVGEILRGRLIPVQVPLGVKREGRAYEQEERSQRSRGFVYAALGSVTAILAGADRLLLAENGVGAINLPYTEAQLGVANTRASHPVSVAMMQELVRLVTGRDLTIELPFLFLTKGQLCRAIAELGVEDLARGTVSCDGFPQRTRGRHQCGRCTSCLLRRASLLAAGLQAYDDPSGYVVDVYSPNAAMSEAKAYPAKAMRDQARRLDRALQTRSPWRMLVREFPMLMEVAQYAAVGGASPRTAEARLVALYEQYCREWRTFEDLWRVPTLPAVA
jgi:hypothetical protein